MIKRAMTGAAGLVVIILCFFTARRWLFTLFALIAPAPVLASQRPQTLPNVLLLVPLRNEAQSLPALLPALAGLDYPVQKLTIVFINDGSTDNSEAILWRWVAGRPTWHICSLAQNKGKANALNTALRRFAQGEIVAIYDADERPQPTALRYLVAPFANPQVGGVSGRRAVSNSLQSPAASYTTFEGLVHQLVTMRAKERLNLAPAILGANCAYRRTALVQAGNFKPGALLEDSDLTLKLVRAGWQIRFEARAVSYHQVPATITGYWKQHARWARGFNEVAKAQAGPLLLDRHLPLPLRLELLTFSVGYLDRLALLGAMVLAVTKKPLVIWALFVSLLTPLVQVVAALKIVKAPPALWRQIGWLPFFFALDMAMAMAGAWHTLRQTPQTWEERQARQSLK